MRAPACAYPYGILAEFADAGALMVALRAAHASGWRRMDAFAPYPIPEAATLLGVRAAPVAWIAIGAGLFGAALSYATQWWLSVHAYPLNVGGRPLHAWPAFLPATTIVAILWSAVGTLLGMLLLNRLPRLHHPVFAVPGFGRASTDRFFLLLRATDPQFHDIDATTRQLLAQAPLRVTTVPCA